MIIPITAVAIVGVILAGWVFVTGIAIALDLFVELKNWMKK